MNNDFVFNQVYKASIKAGAKENFAKQLAVSAMEKYKKSSYMGKPINLIEDSIKEAVKLSKVSK